MRPSTAPTRRGRSFTDQARPWLRRIDPGHGAAALVGLLAAWPFLARAGLPALTDAQHHVYRTLEVINAWRSGVFYLRWAPNLFFGYGYPVFNFYAPAAYYASAAYGWFLGPVAGVKFTFVLAAVLGAVGLYRLARERFEPLPALAGAAAFSLAPYLAYLNPQARGALPEALAAALMPWLLAALARLPGEPGARRLAPAALLMALLMLTHNLMAWVAAALGLAWAAWDGVTVPARRANWKAGLAWPLAAFGLGAGLAAFFLLPAIGELGLVQFTNAFLPTEVFQLVPLAELLAPARLADAAYPDLGHFVFRLGLPQWTLAALGLAGALDPRMRPWRPTLLFFGLAGAVALWFVLPASAGTWAALPGLSYLQFPWRLLGPIALAFGVLAGGAAQWASARLPSAWARGLGLAAVGACLAAALSALNPLPWPDPGPVTYPQMFALERSGAWGVGTTHAGEFLPASVLASPAPNEALLASYARPIPDKVDRASLPVDAAVDVIAHAPDSDTFSVSAPGAFTLRLLTFEFSGWTAWVDGVEAPIAPAEPEGWITLPVPAGTHIVSVRLVDTPIRRAGWLVSAAAGGVWLAVLARGLRRPAPVAPAERLPAGTTAVAVALVAAALALRVVGDAHNPWLSPPRAVDSQPTPQHPLAVQLEDNVMLAGYDLPRSQAAPGGQAALTLYWQATDRVSADLSVFVHLLGPDGQVWGQSDKYVPVPFFPTGRWPVGRVMADSHTVGVSAEAPAGTYTLAAGLWQRDTGRRSQLVDPPPGGHADAILLTDAFRVAP